jgi:hypothetical protein
LRRRWPDYGYDEDEEGDNGEGEEMGLRPIIIDGVRIPTLTDIRRHVKAHAWNGQYFTASMGHHEVFVGQCEYASTAMSEILTGTGKNGKPVNWSLRVRGFYCGDLSEAKIRLLCDERAFTEGKHCHSWVEFGGKIIDPTWWQFAGDPVGVYVFELDDPRFIRDKDA